MARPQKDIDPDEVEKLAAVNCSYAEIAAELDCGTTTLKRRFGPAIKRGRHKMKVSLKRKQFELAMGGNVAMNIWLSKQYLGQHEPRQEFTHEVRELPVIRIERRADD